jgi:ketosteroid isomerase-like protein
MNKSNQEFIESYFESINNKDFDTAFELLSDELDWWILGTTKASGHYTKRTISIGFKLLFKNFENFTFSLSEFTSEADRISVIAESNGIIISIKKIYNNHYHFLFYITNNKI